MTGRLIKKISFRFNDQRITLDADSKGNFLFPTTKVKDGELKTVDTPHSPRFVVEHEKIKNWDPFITLANGEKHRVYQGGDPTYMLVEVQSILDLHQEFIDEANKKELKQTSFCGYPWQDDYEGMF